MYPNPANQNLNVESEFGIENVSVYGITGNIVLDKSTGTLKRIQSIDISRLNNGIYFVKVFSNGQTTYTKFVKK